MSQGSAGNVIAALASFFIPGLGQLAQGRVKAAIGILLVEGVCWVMAFITAGLLGFLLILTRLFASLNAALWRRPVGAK
jgi:TM2 domain-containing membrane protein YozV